jgi:hypothetical protein
MQELKDMVFKNLQKDPIHYTKDGQFGVKGLGYVTEHPGLGTPKEPKGKYASSGYGNLNENKELNVGDTVKYKGTTVTVEKKDEVGNLVLKTENGKTIRANKAQFKTYGSLEEEKLRKAIREMIDAELEEVRGGGNYGIPTINTANIEKGEQKIPTYYILTPEARKEFNLLNPGPNAPSYDESLKIPHIRVTPDNTIFISDLLYVTLGGMEKGRGTREKQIEDNKNRLKVITNEIPDRYWPMVRALFKKFAESKTTIYPVLGKDTLYHEIRFKENGYKVEKLEDWIEKKLEEIENKLAQASSGEVRRGRPINVEALMRFKKQLEDMKPNAKGGMAIIPPPFPIGESLRESVEKDLAAINKEAEHEVLQSKLDKIDDLIDSKKSKLSKLDEDEDMKALTDSKKVKEIQKDIKALEKAKSKVEKMMGKTKDKKKEVLDEMDAEEIAATGELDQDTINGVTEKYDEIWEKNGIVTDQDIQHIANLYPFVEKSFIVDYLTAYGSKTEPNL